MGMLDKFTKEEIEEKIKNSKNIVDFLASINRSTTSGSNRLLVAQYIKDNNIDVSHFSLNIKERTPENIFIVNSDATQSTVRRHYKKGNYSEYKCAICGLEPFWNGQELTLTLDHINGINNDHRLENLRWICPNCDRQLPTFGSKKLKKERVCKECGEKLGDKNKTGLCKLCYQKSHPPKSYIDKDTKRRIYQAKPCPLCGKMISCKSELCFDCFNAKKLKESRSKLETKITQSELKQMIRSTTMQNIAKKFNTSDNVVRKWCNLYLLPSNFTTIYSYNDKQWSEVGNLLYIYLITNLKNGYVFIGISYINNLQEELERLKKIEIPSTSMMSPIVTAINLYGIENFTIELIEETRSYAEAVKQVNTQCEKLNTYIENENSKGYNVKFADTLKPNQKTIIELYEDMNSIAAVSRNTGVTTDAIKQILKKNDIAILPIKERNRKANGKPVNMLSKNGCFIKKFNSIIEAIEFVMIEQNREYNCAKDLTSHISDVCKGKRKSAYGYKWEYATPEKEDTSNI